MTAALRAAAALAPARHAPLLVRRHAASNSTSQQRTPQVQTRAAVLRACRAAAPRPRSRSSSRSTTSSRSTSTCSLRSWRAQAAAGASAAPEREPGPPPIAGDAVLLKHPLPAGQLSYEQQTVVVVGDVPAGTSIRAGGDVIVLGTLLGEAAAGCTGDRSAVVLINALGHGAALSIAGVAPAADEPARRNALMLRLEAEMGALAARFTAMPGTPPLAGAAAVEGVSAKLGRTAGALAVLMLGLALVLAPGSVLGGLLSTSAESIAGAGLDAFVFGWLILQGASLLASGSELLLEILSPGIVGGVVLPVLGALPDSLIILSALSASRAEAQEQVAVGIGTLAGSTILLLSLAWGTSVLLGRCDINERGYAVDKTLTRGWDWTRTGVSVDRDVCQGAVIMAASVLLYGIVQVPAFLGASDSPQAALIGAATCLFACVAYCVWSVLNPQLQQRRIDAARRKRFRMVTVKALALRSTEVHGSSLVDPLGRLNRDTARAIFEEFDKDNSGAIDSTEVQGLLLGLQLAGGGTTTSIDRDTVEYLFKEFDVNSDRSITFDEFTAALSRWVDEKMVATAGGGAQGSSRFSALLDPRRGGAAAAVLQDLPVEDLEALQNTALELEGESPEDAAEDLEGAEPGSAPLSTRDILLRSVAKMGAGIGICAVFSDPLVDALTALSRATGISPFVVGFVLTPLASNSSELVSSLTFASRKRKKNMSLTLSQIYGAVTMNSTLVLGLFLIVVWLQRLQWVYSSEVTVIVACTLVIAVLGSTRTTFPTWQALVAMSLYPLSLAGVYALDTWLGWQ